MEESEFCVKDYVEVRERGPNLSPKGARFCGSSADNEPLNPLPEGPIEVPTPAQETGAKVWVLCR